jgi:hypothetical protein
VDNDVVPGCKLGQDFSKRFTNKSLEPVAHYRVAMLTRHCYAKSCWFVYSSIHIVDNQFAISEHLTVCISIIIL